jgi:hypothetical protein
MTRVHVSCRKGGECDFWPVGRPDRGMPEAHVCLRCGKIHFYFGPCLNLLPVPQPPPDWARQVAAGTEPAPAEVTGLAMELLRLHMTKGMALI